MNRIKESVEILRKSVAGFFNGSEEEAMNNSDALLDIAVQYPEELVWFIKVVTFFGTLSGVLISIPCLVFLYLHWAGSASCDRPLRMWLLLHCALQLVQAPVRLVFFIQVSRFQLMGQSILSCFRRLTCSSAWRASKMISLFIYGWFILGVVWVLNTTSCQHAPALYHLAVAVVCTACSRIFITLLCFYKSFPQRVRVVGANKRTVMGADQKTLDALPVLIYGSPQNENDKSCSICLSDFECGDQLRELPCCHAFHLSCIDQWLVKNCTCPLCLRDIGQIAPKWSPYNLASRFTSYRT
eukprot:Platyproteum_vivax@DN6888_c0_g1_i2.p1